MKRGKLHAMILAVITAFILTSCEAPVTITTWKNPDYKSQISKVAVMPLFEKLEYMKPFEQAIDATFERKGLKAIGSLEFLNPNIKYPVDDIKRKCDSLGVNGLLLFVYKGSDKSESYVPETTYVTGGWGGYWGGGYWGGGYYGNPYYGTTVSTGGYWTTTTVVNLRASLYVKGSKDAVWTGDLTVTDPQHIDQVGATIGNYIYDDWAKYGLIKFPEKKK